MLGQRQFDIAIVGGGLSGCALAAVLADTLPSYARVALIGEGPPGRGAAYGPAPGLFMNGPAREMSAVESDSEDLVRFAGVEPDALVERCTYGAYASHVLARARARHSGIDVFQERALTARDMGDRFEIATVTGSRIAAQIVVLAIGNPPPASMLIPAAIRNDVRVYGNPWAFDARSMSGRVALLGSGLTAVDVASQLLDNARVERVEIISRHGRLPLLERPELRAAAFDDLALATHSPLALVRSLRRAAHRSQLQGGDWRSVVDAIRRRTPAIWQSWTMRQRRQFLRHVQSIWAMHRYRAPEANLRTLERGMRDGRVRIHRNTLADAAADGVRLALFLGKGSIAMNVDALVNCTGPSFSGALRRDGFLSSLTTARLIRPDALNLGFDVAETLAAYGVDGRAHERLFVIGPAARGTFFESTAIPEIRRQAVSLATTIGSVLAKNTAGAA